MKQMTQTEHLELIRARCVELLEIAEKRTAGMWKCKFAIDKHLALAVTDDGYYAVAQSFCRPDATFIASCTGAAEAGWLATIAAIDAFFKLDSVTYGWDGDCGATCIADIMADSITSAWPIELLNNK